MHSHEEAGIHFVAGRWPLAPDKATIVFIHGSGGSHRLWGGQVDALAAHVNTVALDLPGHGRTGGAGRDSVADYAGVVDDFIAAIGTPHPVPCGLSLGGAIVQQLLLDRPKRFKAGILMGTGARLKVLPAIFEALAGDFKGFLEMLDKFAFSPATPGEVKAPVLADTAACDPSVTSGDFMACDRFDVMSRLPEMAVPVLVVTAEDDRMTPPKYGQFLKAHIPGASRVHLQAAGHLMPVEQPEALNRAILDFLVTGGIA